MRYVSGRILAMAGGVLALGMVALAPQAGASQLVYQPLSPSFGGDPFVGSFLIETARDQNRYRRDDSAFPDINIPDFSFDVPPIIIAPGLTGGAQGGSEVFVNQ